MRDVIFGFGWKGGSAGYGGGVGDGGGGQRRCGGARGGEGSVIARSLGDRIRHGVDWLGEERRNEG